MSESNESPNHDSNEQSQPASSLQTQTQPIGTVVMSTTPKTNLLPRNTVYRGENITPVDAMNRSAKLQATIDNSKIFNNGFGLHDGLLGTDAGKSSSPIHANLAGGTVQGAGSIAAQAQGLNNNWQNICQFVRDNIDWEPSWGLMNGALGCLLGGRGAAWDQSSLLVSLLRQAGYTANYVVGTIQLSAATAANWFGTNPSSLTSSLNYLSAVGIPQGSYTDGGGNTWLIMNHVWVQFVVPGIGTLVFDPSFKTYTWSTALMTNPATAMGFNLTSFMSDIETGATVDPSGNFVQNMNRAKAVTDLTTYSTNLIAWMKTNAPTAQMNDLLGGPTIVQLPVTALTALPYLEPGSTSIIYTGDVPTSYKTTLQVQYAGINQTFTSDQLVGQRLSFYNNTGTTPSLMLSGSVVQTGAAQTANTFATVSFTVTYNALGSYVSSSTETIYTSGMAVIGTAFSAIGRGLADSHQGQLNANAFTAGVTTVTEAVLGESLMVSWSMWVAEQSRARDIVDTLNGTKTNILNCVGLVGQTGTNAYFGTNTFTASFDYSGGTTAGPVSFKLLGILQSSLQGIVLGQMSGTTPVITSAKVLDAANAAGNKIYGGTSTNWSSIVSPALSANGYTAAPLSGFNALFSQGFNILAVHDHPSVTLGNWAGYSIEGLGASTGYDLLYQISSGNGLASVPSTGVNNTPAQTSTGGMVFNQTWVPYPIMASGSPANLASGSYTYQRSDISVGSQAFPYGLTFERYYSSDNQYEVGPIGRGWSHKYEISAKVNSDGMMGLGSQFALQGVSALVNIYVSLQLMSDTTQPITKIVAANLTNSWWIDQMINNTVDVSYMDNAQTFVKQADGSYCPPFRSAASLTLSGGAYTVTTPQGAKTIFNTSGQVTSFVFPTGATVTCGYNSSAQLTSVKTLGRTLTIAYNTNGLISSVTDGTRTVSYGYDSNSNLTSFTDANSKIYTFSYVGGTGGVGLMQHYFKPANPMIAYTTNTFDSLGRLATQANALGETTSFYFGGSRTQEVDPVGNIQVRYFNRNGLVLRDIQSDPTGANVVETDHFYDGLGRRIQSYMPEGNNTIWTYDLNNNVLTETNVAKPGSTLANIVKSYTYDPVWALVKTATDPNTNVTTYNYDPIKGTLLTLQRPEVNGQIPTVTSTWDSRGQLLTVTDETGVINKNTYSTTNETLLSTVVDYSTSSGHLNLTTNFGYDTAGNTNSIQDQNGNTTTSVYDNERRLTQITSASPFSYVTNKTYDANGNLLNVQCQTGNSANPWQITTWTYSVTEQKLTKTDSAGQITNWFYDGKDRLAFVIDAMNRETQWSYDYRDNLYQTTDATAVICDTRSYTPNGLLASRQDSRNNVTHYNYDGFDRPFQTTYADGTYEQNVSYDANSNVLTAQTRATNQIVNTFDVLNRLSTKAPASQPTVTFAYDLAGRLLSATKPTVSGDPSSGAFSKLYDTAGRFYQETYPDGKQVTLGLDSNGNVTKLTYPDGYYVTRSYDALNRLFQIFLNGATTQAATLAYDELSRHASLTYNNGTSVGYSYASAVVNDLTNIAHNFVGSNVAFGYGYNFDHEITGQSVTDGSYQWQPTLGSVAYAAANSVNEYPSVGGTAYSYNPDGCLTSNGVWTFGYDTESHLTSASMSGTSVAYVYDSFHRQAQKLVTTSGGIVSSRYIYSSWQRIADYDGVAGTLQNRYVYADGLDEPLMQVTSAGVVTYYHANAQGSVIGVSNSAGAVVSKNLYGLFGETSTLSGTTFGFTGQRFDVDTGLYYYKNRYYSPAIGRFLQSDPAGYTDDHPNLYTYAGNSPAVNRDPMGLKREGPMSPHSRQLENTRSNLMSNLDKNFPTAQNTKYYKSSVVANMRAAGKHPLDLLYFLRKVPAFHPMDYKSYFTTESTNPYALLRKNGGRPIGHNRGNKAPEEVQRYGNFNYGAVAAAMYIPNVVAHIGAGAAQIAAGTSNIGFWYTLFDDPVDFAAIDAGYGWGQAVMVNQAQLSVEAQLLQGNYATSGDMSGVATLFTVD